MFDSDFPLIQILNQLPDERQLAKVHHPIAIIVFIAIVCSVAGADDWESMELYAEEHLEWFKSLFHCPMEFHRTIE